MTSSDMVISKSSPIFRPTTNSNFVAMRAGFMKFVATQLVFLASASRLLTAAVSQKLTEPWSGSADTIYTRLVTTSPTQQPTRKTAGTAENPAANKLSFVISSLRW